MSSLKMNMGKIDINKPPPPMVSPRLRSAISTAISMDGEVEGENIYGGVKSLSSFKFNDSFSKDEVDKRESVWQLRRDKKVLEKQKRLQKRANTSSGVCIFKRGSKISGRRMILSVECLKEDINGTLRFTAYDPVSSEGFEHTEKHIDTTGLIPLKRNTYLSGEKDRRVMDLCKQLRLERSGKGVGPVVLIMFGIDEISGKMR